MILAARPELRHALSAARKGGTETLARTLKELTFCSSILRTFRRSVLFSGLSLAFSNGCNKENNVDASSDNSVTENCSDLSCAECEEGTFACGESALYACREDEKGYEFFQDCFSAALCEVEDDGRAGRCLAPACAPGDHRCEGATLSVCKPDRSGFDSYECSSAQTCRIGRADGVCGDLCRTAEQCVGVVNECQKPACIDELCAVDYSPDGVELATQVAGDCAVEVCDGEGGEKSMADDTDLPDSPSECTTAGCDGGVETLQYQPAGTSCSEGEGTCDGNGSCQVCSPGAVDGCSTSTAQRWCSGAGVWSTRECSTLDPNRPSCGGDGSCYGGSPLAWVPIGSDSSYGIDQHEVTRAQYDAWLTTNPSIAGQGSVCAWNDSFVPSCQWPIGSFGQRPVVCVDWCDASAYCAAVGKRLCGRIGGGTSTLGDVADATQSQWYRACSQGGSSNWPYGNDFLSDACAGSASALTAAQDVGVTTSCRGEDAPYADIEDLSGNVFEWEAACDASGETPASDACRWRGGSFRSESTQLRCDDHATAYRDEKYEDVGFRCCTL